MITRNGYPLFYRIGKTTAPEPAPPQDEVIEQPDTKPDLPVVPPKRPPVPPSPPANPPIAPPPRPTPVAEEVLPEPEPVREVLPPVPQTPHFPPRIPKAPAPPEFKNPTPREPDAPPFPRTKPVIKPDIPVLAPKDPEDPIPVPIPVAPQPAPPRTDCSQGQPPLNPALPPVPPGHPCYVTRRQVETNEGPIDRADYRDAIRQATTLALLGKRRELFKTLTSKPEYVHAAILTMSGGVWNFVDPDYGTISDNAVTRPSQGYGLGVISEKWTRDLHGMATFVAGPEFAARLGPYPLGAPGEPYSMGPSLVNKATAPYWLLAYAGMMDVQLGLELGFFPDFVLVKDKASSLTKQAQAKLAAIDSRSATGLWLCAWFRFGSATGAARGILDGSAPLGVYLTNLKAVQGT